MVSSTPSLTPLTSPLPWASVLFLRDYSSGSCRGLKYQNGTFSTTNFSKTLLFVFTIRTFGSGFGLVHFITGNRLNRSIEDERGIQVIRKHQGTRNCHFILLRRKSLVILFYFIGRFTNGVTKTGSGNTTDEQKVGPRSAPCGRGKHLRLLFFFHLTFLCWKLREDVSLTLCPSF